MQSPASLSGCNTASMPRSSTHPITAFVKTDHDFGLLALGRMFLCAHSNGLICYQPSLWNNSSYPKTLILDTQTPCPHPTLRPNKLKKHCAMLPKTEQQVIGSLRGTVPQSSCPIQNPAPSLPRSLLANEQDIGLAQEGDDLHTRNRPDCGDMTRDALFLIQPRVTTTTSSETP